MENLTSKQKTILLIAGVIVVGLFVFYMSTRDNTYNQIETNEDLISNNESIDEANEEKKIKIHITGAVKNQGVVELDNGSRIQDAIEEAGGLTEQADISNVNLAYTLKDSQKIYIPLIADITTEEIISSENGAEVIVDEGKHIESSTDKKININLASSAELSTLNGIGQGTAEKIIEYRTNNGKFNSITEIKNVSGIGEAKYQSIKDYITVE